MTEQTRALAIWQIDYSFPEPGGIFIQLNVVNKIQNEVTFIIFEELRVQSFL